MASIQQERAEIAAVLRAQAAANKLPRISTEQGDADFAVAVHLHIASKTMTALHACDPQLHAQRSSLAATAQAHCAFAQLLANPAVLDAAKRAYGVEDGTISSHAADGVV